MLNIDHVWKYQFGKKKEDPLLTYSSDVTFVGEIGPALQIEQL